jgi:hypothetical protein
MGSLAWRALGQAALIYLAIGASAVTAQDTQPGRTTFAEMIAFARLGSVACERVVPDVEGFHALALQRLIKPPLTEKEIGAKEKDVKRLRDRVGLNGWCKRYAGKMEQAAFWFRLYEGKISSAFFVLAAPDVPSPPCGKFIHAIGAGTASDHHNSYLLSW